MRRRMIAIQWGKRRKMYMRAEVKVKEIDVLLMIPTWCGVLSCKCQQTQEMRRAGESNVETIFRQMLLAEKRRREEDLRQY
jgi:hypothetical protein